MQRLPEKPAICVAALAFVSVLLLALVGPAVAGAASGNDEILLGMSTALTGSAAGLGESMRSGVLLGIEEANRAGGIHGRSLRLLCLDDGYEPRQTIPNMRTLINDEGVVAIVGNVGTPTAVSAIPIANETGTPFFGAYTGAGILRKKPPDRWVINYRASYREEMYAMIRALVGKGGIKPEEVAFFTQRDAYGDAGYYAGVEALVEQGLTDAGSVARAQYERNSLAVEGALARILLHEPQPKAVIMVGSYAPSAKFIRLAKENNLNAFFLSVSFTGAEFLCEELGDLGAGVIATQVVPHYDSDTPLVREYREALEQIAPEAQPSFASLEGYVIMRILFRALETIDGPPTRSAIADALEGLGEFDIGLGERLRLGPDEHQACHRVWPTVFRNGRVVSCNWEELIGLFREESR